MQTKRMGRYKHIIFLVIGIIYTVPLLSQVPAVALKQIKNTEEARQYIEQNPQYGAGLFDVANSKDTAPFMMPYYQKKVGYVFILEDHFYKIVNKIIYPEFRVSYLFLDGKKLDMKTIDSLRAVIVDALQQQTPFPELVAKYNMDGNRTGDLGWFAEGRMVKTFETAVRAHKKGDIFLVDIPEYQWYYVVYKTFDDRKVTKLSLFSIKSDLITR